MRPWYDSDVTLACILLLFAVSLIASAADWHLVAHLSWGSALRVAAGVLTVARTRRREAKQEHGKDPNRD